VCNQKKFEKINEKKKKKKKNSYKLYYKQILKKEKDF